MRLCALVAAHPLPTAIHPFQPLPKSIQYLPHSGPPTHLTCHHLHSGTAPPILASLLQQSFSKHRPQSFLLLLLQECIPDINVVVHIHKHQQGGFGRVLVKYRKHHFSPSSLQSTSASLPKFTSTYIIIQIYNLHIKNASIYNY